MSLSLDRFYIYSLNFHSHDRFDLYLYFLPCDGNLPLAQMSPSVQVQIHKPQVSIVEREEVYD